MLEAGPRSAESMFRSAAIVNRVLTWILRAVGFVFVFGGVLLVFRPIAVLGSVVPIFGSLLEAGLWLFSLGMGAALALLDRRHRLALLPPALRPRPAARHRGDAPVAAPARRAAAAPGLSRAGVRRRFQRPPPPAGLSGSTRMRATRRPLEGEDGEPVGLHRRLWPGTGMWPRRSSTSPARVT